MPDRSPGYVQRTVVDCELGAVDRLPQHLARLGVARPVVLVDPGLESTPTPDLMRRLLPDAQQVLAPAGEPTARSVAQAADDVLESDADAVVAVGGGSTLDTAKLLRGMLADDVRTLPLPASSSTKPLPLVTIPTTAGTGAELGAGAIVHDPQADTKVVVRIPELAADVAVCDGRLTLSLPADLTAFTGLDAYAQAILAYVPAGPRSVSGQQALTGIRVIRSSLPRAVSDPGDEEARADMMLGSVISALGMFNAPPTYAGEHLFAEPIGAAFGLNHGHTVAAMLAGTVELNVDALRQPFAHLGRNLDLNGSDLAQAFADDTRRFVRQLGVPGLAERTTVTVAEAVKTLHNKADLGLNPMPLSDRDLSALVSGAFDGSFTLK